MLSTKDILKSVASGFIGGAIGEAIIEIKRFKSIDPSKIVRSAVVGAVVTPAHRMASDGLRSVLGLPNYAVKDADDDVDNSDHNWSAATD